MKTLQQNELPFLVLGTSGRKSLTLTGSDFERHKWIMGISGSGKSTLLAWIALSLLRLGIAFCIIDPHGDLARLIVSLLASSKFFTNEKAFQRLWFVDFHRDDKTIPFNVLKQPHVTNYQVSNNLLEAIHRAFPTTSGTTASLDNTITYAAFVLAENGLPLTALQHFLLDSAFREKLLRNITDAQVKQFFDFKFADKVSSQLIDSTMRRLDLLTFSLPLRHALGHRDNKLNFRYHMDNQISCLISLGGLDDQSKRLLGCLLMTSLEQSFLSRATLAPDRRFPYHVIVDEFPLFSASGDSFSIILEQVRKYKGTLYLAHQTLSQLQKGMMGSLQNAIPIIMKAGTDDSSALVSRFYRPTQEEPAGFFDLLFGNAPSPSPFASVTNVTQARQIFETLQRQEALVTLNHEVKRIITPTLPIKEDRKLLAEIEDTYASRLLVPIVGNQVEKTVPTLTLVPSAPALRVVRRSYTPAPDEKEPLTLITGIVETDILLSLYTLHYATLVQVCAFVSKSQNYVRNKINDLMQEALIDKVTLPSTSSGKPPSVFYLTKKGQTRIADVMGLPVPLSTGERKHQFLEHTIDCNQVLLVGIQLAKSNIGLRLVDLKIDRTMKANPYLSGALIPDVFFQFRASSNEDIPLLCEIDRNSENRDRIISKLNNYHAFISSGEYSQAFGNSALTIAFIVTNGGDRRVKQLLTLGKEVLEDKPATKNLFLIGNATSFSPALFTEPVFTGLDTIAHSLIEKPY